ncbi:MAG: metallophosphoesterase [Clostridia bacterium]|nr:metallophosphoesterase [Clostridia bacterium]
MNLNFKIKGQKLVRVDSKTVAENSRNFLSAEFVFDESWDGFSKKAVFVYRDKAYGQMLTDNRCVVPHEVIRAQGFYVAVIGVDGDENARITSSRVKVAVVQGPALDTENSSEPTPTELEQLMSVIDSVKEETKELSDRIDGFSEGDFPGCGEVDPVEIRSALEEYLKDNPIVTEETDPTVPDWVKNQPNMPTADDVGARPADWMPIADDVGARPADWMPTAADVGAEAKGTAADAVAAHNSSASAHSNVITAHNTSGSAHDDIRNLIKNKADKTDIPTVPQWVKDHPDMLTAADVGARPDDWMPTAADVGADAKGTAANSMTAHNSSVSVHEGLMNSHNTSGSAHNDIRNLIKNKADKDDIPTVPDWAKADTKPAYTADEVGARPDTWMPSADEVGALPRGWLPTPAQIGAITEEKVTNYLKLKADKSDFTAHAGNGDIHVTSAERTAWNAKSNFSGSYNDLTGKPTIPTVPTNVSEFTNDANYVNGTELESAINEALKKTEDGLEEVDSIDKMTDTSKQYVYNGYIYEYREATSGEVVQRITEGFESDKRVSTSSGGLSAGTGFVATPLIDVSSMPLDFTLRLAGIQWYYSTEKNQTNGYSHAIYNDGVYINNSGDYNYNLSKSYNYKLECKDNGELHIKPNDTTKSRQFTQIRISGKGTAADAIVELIYTGEGKPAGWYSTGFAYDPDNTDGVPVYVATEAVRVADKVIAARDAKSFVFGAVSDLHTDGSEESVPGILHAGMGMNEINKRTRLDMFALFGDVPYTYFGGANENGFPYVRKCFYDISKAVPFIQMQGNHDIPKKSKTKEDHENSYAYVGANNIGTVTDWDNRYRNYGYRDFEDLKMRVFYLNTADISEAPASVTGDCYISANQMKWVVERISELSNKNDAANWSFVVCSHHPLRWGGDGNNMQQLLDLLKAYKNKTSGNITVDSTTVNYDFSSAAAEFIAHFHGHLHNFRYESLDGVWSVTIPNACFNRNNEYGDGNYPDLYGENVVSDVAKEFNKTANTAADTAFNVVVIDRTNHKIHCFTYGAGTNDEGEIITDREITYKET